MTNDDHKAQLGLLFPSEVVITEMKNKKSPRAV